MEKYVNIKSIEEAGDDEVIVALYSSPSQNVSGTKSDKRIIAAEKDAKVGACELLVWRNVGKTTLTGLDYVISSDVLNRIVRDYKSYVEAYDNCPDMYNKKWELYGRAEQLKTVLGLIGYDTTTLPTYAKVESDGRFEEYEE